MPTLPEIRIPMPEEEQPLTLYGRITNTNEPPKYDDIMNSNLPREEKARQIQYRTQAYQDDLDRQLHKDYARMGVGTALSAASFHPFFNIPYVGTGIGGAMYDLGQGIVEGDTAGDLAKRAGRGFVIGETIGAIPYAGKALGKTKAGQAVIRPLSKATTNLTNNIIQNTGMIRPIRAAGQMLNSDINLGRGLFFNPFSNPVKSGNIAFDSNFNPEIEDIARNYFGTTTNRREAGYILNDGSYLDFSGKRFGGSPGRRSIDHREVVDAFLDNPANKNNLEVGFDEFIDNGAVRYMPESNSFFMSRQPSEAQIKRIKDLLDYERGKSSIELVPNVSDWGTNKGFRRDYALWSDPKKIIEDINTYYKGGKPSNLRDYL